MTKSSFLFFCLGCAPPTHHAIQLAEQGKYADSEQILVEQQRYEKDPGWVAYNLAWLQFQNKNYTQAIQNLERCLDDETISNTRANYAQFNLAISLILDNSQKLSAIYLQSIQWLERIDPKENITLAMDREMALEIAKRLYQQSKLQTPRIQQAKNNTITPAQEDEPSQPSDPSAAFNPSQNNKSATANPKSNQYPKPTNPNTFAGAGNLPVLEDQETVTILSLRQIDQLLDFTEARLDKERAKARQGNARERQRPNDW